MAFFRSPRPTPEPPEPHPATGADVIPLTRVAAGELGSSSPFGVNSEVGRLRRVIVHRPGLELRRLTPENKDWLLFDDVVWAERAEQEHDDFTDMLRSHGVEVLYVHDLLADVLESPEARAAVLEATLQETAIGPTLASPLESWLATLGARELAGRLIGGISYDELPFVSTSLVARLSATDAFVLHPLSNQLFTRDSSTWVSRFVFTPRMAKASRRRETIHMAAIYRFHPLFAAAGKWQRSDQIGLGTEVEGGDVLVLSDSALLVGMGERTRPAAVELFARELFEASVIDSLIAVTLPRSRASIHLDAVLTMVDVDAFMVYPPVWDTLEAYVLRPSGRGVSTARADLPSVIAHTIGWKPRLIGGASDPEIARREQWNEAANLLAVAPGTVIANERNTRANASLREHGVEVLTVPASEIARGRGGPRCLTCPVARDSI